MILFTLTAFTEKHTETYIFVMFISALIQSLVIPIFFDYKIRQLIVPACIGSFIAFTLMFFYEYPEIMARIFHF